MNEKVNKLRSICDVVGLLSLFVYFLMTLAGNENIFLVLRIIFASIALAAYSIEFGARIISNQKIAGSIFMVFMCMVDIIFTVLWFI